VVESGTARPTFSCRHTGITVSEAIRRAIRQDLRASRQDEQLAASVLGVGLAGQQSGAGRVVDGLLPACLVTSSTSASRASGSGRRAGRG
jgi:hypothetical protein